MCQITGGPPGSGSPVRLLRCPHGAYFLTVGQATLHLSEEELSLVGRALHAMAGRQPTLLARLAAHWVEQRPGGASDN